MPRLSLHHTLRPIVMAAAALTVAATTSAATPKKQAATYEMADQAFHAYRFDEAETLLSQYASKRTKAQIQADITIDPDTGEEIDRVDRLRAKVLMGRNMMERVEQIQLIDSMQVDRDTFFNFYRLAATSGALRNQASLLNAQRGLTVVEPVYVTEDSQSMLWVGYNDGAMQPDFTLYETTRLADGKLTEPQPLFNRAKVFADGVDGQIYSPFLMPDGVTLYFAADGDKSLGGLDIFIARRDGDRFLQPSNVGMPYNSPANDYMLAIDETTGLGWWASDRYAPDDMVTIYMFAHEDIRVNYSPDTPELESLASLSNAPLSPDRIKILTLLDNEETINPTAPQQPEFQFAMPGGRIYTQMSQFKSSKARQLMQQYLDAEKALNQQKRRLSGMRERYASGDIRVEDSIHALETQLDSDSQKLLELSNSIVKAEN